MNLQLIHKLKDEYAEYLHDESRSIGYADDISFPRSEQEVIEILTYMHEHDTPVTIQGARTGLAAGAVPYGGHIMNMSYMDHIVGMREDDKGHFYITVQPNVILSQLRKSIMNRQFNTGRWNAASKKTYSRFCNTPEQFFPPDPTEASASIGGMVACNASGARSFLYGPTRKHINRLRVVLSSGQTLCLERGKCYAKGRLLSLETEQGARYQLDLPTYNMPESKNASGYYIMDNMDAIDLFIGSDGTLGVFTEIELALSPLPEVIWGINCFFSNEQNAIDFVCLVRSKLENVASIEFFDRNALSILRSQKHTSSAFSQLPDIDDAMDSAISIELHCSSESNVLSRLFEIGNMMEGLGESQENTWVARNETDLAMLSFFRHAVPESVNMLIDQRKRLNPAITKLGTDMSVPDKHLTDIMKMYRTMLEKYKLESAIWGHIGNNHLHVNILPSNEHDYKKGKELYALWANEVTGLGGAVSAEHGVGKLKSAFLTIMYGKEHIEEMRALKAALDPKGRLGAGNLFPSGREVKKI